MIDEITSESPTATFVRDSNPFPAPVGGGSAWLPAVEEVHAPTIYASLDQAAAGLGGKIAREIREHGIEPAAINIALDSSTVHGAAITNSIQEALNRDLPNTAIQLEAVTSEQSLADTAGDNSNACRIILKLDILQDQPAPWNEAIAEREMAEVNAKSTASDHPTRGTIHAQIVMAGHSNAVNTDFIDKPWVVNYSKFLTGRAGIPWIKALSYDLLAENQHAARRQAAHAAAQQIAQHVRSVAAGMAGNASKVESLQTIVRDLENEIVNGQHVADEFAQELDTGEGQVWRHAYLISFPTDQVNKRAARAVHVARAERVHRASQLASVVGLSVLTMAMFLFLNVATKGFYREALIGAAVLIVLAGGAAILFIP